MKSVHLIFIMEVMRHVEVVVNGIMTVSPPASLLSHDGLWGAVIDGHTLNSDGCSGYALDTDKSQSSCYFSFGLDNNVINVHYT